MATSWSFRSFARGSHTFTSWRRNCQPNRRQLLSSTCMMATMMLPTTPPAYSQIEIPDGGAPPHQWSARRSAGTLATPLPFMLTRSRFDDVPYISSVGTCSTKTLAASGGFNACRLTQHRLRTGCHFQSRGRVCGTRNSPSFRGFRGASLCTQTASSEAT